MADIFCDFFKNLTPPPDYMVQVIEKHIDSTNSFLRNRILVDILPKWEKKYVEQIKLKLTMLATHPDCHNNDLECFKIIVANTLTDEKWVLRWLKFRKEQAIERVEMFNQLEHKIKF